MSGIGKTKLGSGRVRVRQECWNIRSGISGYFIYAKVFLGIMGISLFWSLWAGLNKFWNPAIPDWRTWSKFKEHWDDGKDIKHRGSPVLQLRCSTVLQPRCSPVLQLRCSPVLQLRCSSVLQLRYSPVLQLRCSPVLQLFILLLKNHQNTSEGEMQGYNHWFSNKDIHWMLVDRKPRRIFLLLTL